MAPWVLVIGVVAGCTPHDAREVADARTASEVPGSCPAGPVERRPLILPDGSPAYVEPTNLMRVGDDFVVVGWPTYTWRVGGDRASQTTSGMHLAAYLDPGPPRLVEIPLQVPVGFVRAVPLDERRWAVLLSERSPDEESKRSGQVLRLWYAEYDGGQWTTLEEVPIPAGVELFGPASSELVAHEDVLAFAALTDLTGGVLYFERRDGIWRSEVVEEKGLEATAMASGSTGLWLAMSGLDPGISGPRKSVRIFHRDGAWRLVSRTPTAQTYTEIHTPQLLALADGVTATWLEIRDDMVAMARVGVRPEAPGELRRVDGGARVVRSFVGGDGRPAWVVQHANEISGASELRLVRLTERGTTVAQAIPNPYTGLHAPVASGPDQVLVTGAEFNPDPAHPPVRSLTLRLNPSCR